VVFLVEQHLTMSQVAQKQDLADPEVILAFARKVGTERRLTALYLLTVADIRGTSPKVWNAWKGKLLEDLFRMTAGVLKGSHGTAALRRRRAPGGSARLLRYHGLRPGHRSGLVEPARHRLFHAPRRRRDRLAHPHPLPRPDSAQPWCGRA
jgi:[protein-PII] uridylyltransferase